MQKINQESIPLRIMQRTCRFELSDIERHKLFSALDDITYDPHGGMRYITELRMIALKLLPRKIIDALHEQRASINPRSHLIFENLPVDHRVFTTPDPQTFTPNAKSGCISENLIMMVASMIGEPYSISFEGADIVNNLIPVTKTRNEYTGLGSEVELDFHIENAALKYMGDYNFSPLGLLLTGVRYDPDGPLTRLSDSRDALTRMSAEDIDYLKLPLYRIKVPYRWRRGSPNDSPFQTDPVPIIRGSMDFPEICAVFYPDMIESQSDRASRALAEFYAAIRDVSFGVDIRPGQLIYIDNRFTLHSRDRFVATFDENGNPMRWVQRVFVSANLWNHRNLSTVKSRVFEPTGTSAC